MVKSTIIAGLAMENAIITVRRTNPIASSCGRWRNRGSGFEHLRHVVADVLPPH
jgi:hypothetical protein